MKGNILKTNLESWLRNRKVRVALFGPGTSRSEWESLSTLAWSRYRPLIEVVRDNKEADLLVIEGPLSKAVWPALERWCMGNKPVLVVGGEVSLDETGYLLNSENQTSRIRAILQIGGPVPAPRELRQATLEALKRYYALH